MNIRSILAVVTAATGALALYPDSARALPVELVNTTSLVATSDTNDHSIGPSAVSTDGRYALFHSAASNLVPGDTNGIGDLFLHDAVNGTRERINVGFGGVQANGLTSSTASVSDDGRFVVFSSRATNLGASQMGVREQIYLRDRQLHATTLLTHSLDGTPFPADSSDPRITPDGRYVVFSCSGAIVGTDTNLMRDVYRLDRTTGEFVIVSVSSVGNQGNQDSYAAQISDNGNYVAFYTWANNLVPGDTNLYWDLILRDIAAGTTTRVSVNTQGQQLETYPYLASGKAFSSDGRFVVFSSLESGGPADTNGESDAFRFDRLDDSVTQVSFDSNGQPINGATYPVSLSSDGKKLLLHSYAANVVPGQPEQLDRIFLRDLDSGTVTHVSSQTGTTSQEQDGYAHGMSGDASVVYFMRYDYPYFLGSGNGFYNVFRRAVAAPAATRISVAYPGYAAASANEHSGQSFVHGPSVSADGRYVAFDSRASNLVAGDNNGVSDVFIRDRLTATTQRITNTGGTVGNCGSDSPTITPDGRYVTFVGCTVPFPGAAAGFDVYRHDRQTGVTLLISGYPQTDQPSGYSLQPHISDDGDVIAFTSCVRLTDDDNYPNCDVYVRTVSTGSLLLGSRVLLSTTGNGDSMYPLVSGNGRYVGFGSDNSNLIAGDSNNAWDAFVFDRVSQTVERVSLNNAGVEGDSGGSLQGISSDGNAVLFMSFSSNFGVPSHGNLFVRQRDIATTEWVSHDSNGNWQHIGSSTLSADGKRVAYTIYSFTQDDFYSSNETIVTFDRTRQRIDPVLQQAANGWVMNLHFSANGDFLVFASNATNLGPYDGNHRFRDIFIARDLNDKIFDAGFE